MKDKKKVLSIVFNELKNDNRVFNQAFSLSSNGYDVTVMGILGIGIKTSLPAEESLNGVKIIRQRMMNKKIERIKYLRILYFMFNSWIQFYKQARNQYGFVHCHDLNTLQYGVLMKFSKLGKIKLIYDAHEYETQRNGLHGWRWTYVKLKERFLIKLCDRVITVSPTIADEYVRLYGIEKPAVVLNCPILRSKEIVKKDIFREKFGIADSTKIMLYQGGMCKGRGINIILETFDELSFKGVAFVFLGEGELTDKVKKHRKYGESIFHHPYVSGDVLLEYTSSADVGVSFGEDICLSYRYSLPNKMFEFIAAGLPVIGSAGLVEAKELIYKYQVGVTADTDDVEGLANVINNLSDLWSQEIKDNLMKARAKFNWEMQERILLGIYEQLEQS